MLEDNESLQYHAALFLVNRDYAREAKKQPTDKNRKRP